MRRFVIPLLAAMCISFGMLPLIVLVEAQDPVPVEGKHKDKRKHVEPVTPAPAPHIEPEPDPNFEVIVPDVERPRPKHPDRVEPDRRPVPPAKPVVIHQGSWFSWFGGVFVGVVLGFVSSWLATFAKLGTYVGKLFGL